jgi:DNA-binding FadR family transcriptional regulator
MGHMDDFRPIERRRASDEVAIRIRELLGSGKLVPGDRLPAERDLAQQLGVGRGALREALRSLEESGLLRRKPGKAGGSFVAEGDLGSVAGPMADLIRLGGVTPLDVTEARLLIEEVVVRLACVRATDEDLDVLERMVEEAKALYERGLMTEKTHRNIEFYEVLAESTKNPVIAIIMRSITAVLRQVSEVIGSHPGRSIILSHQRLLRALRRRDQEAAVAETRKNLVKVQRWYASLEAQPNKQA